MEFGGRRAAGWLRGGRGDRKTGHRTGRKMEETDWGGGWVRTKNNDLYACRRQNETHHFVH